MQPWTEKRHIPVCLRILLQMELDPLGVGQVQAELRQLEEEADTFLGMSCSVHPFSCPGFGRRELGLVTEIESSAVGQRLRNPKLLCWALAVLLSLGHPQHPGGLESLCITQGGADTPRDSGEISGRAVMLWEG